MTKRSRDKEPVTAARPRQRLSQADVPAYSLSEALRVARAIFNNYGGDPTKPLHVAAAMELKPGSSQFKMLAGAAIAYGLTNGGPNAETIGLTDLAKQILRPLEEGAELSGKRAAFLKPRVIGEFISKYDGSPLPKDQIAKNVLAEMGVPANKLNSTLALITNEATTLGLTTQIKGATYVSVDAPKAGNAEPHEDVTEHAVDSVGDTDRQADQTGEHANSTRDLRDIANNRRVYISHGKNKQFIEPIRKLLRFGELEAVVSVEKQSVSKPVPDKVMAEMRSCGAAIIHVDGELKLLDQSAAEHQVLNPNVLIEIGAAMALYGRRFILLVKDGVSLPTNLQGLYEVRYSGDTLDGETTIKLLEAINAMKSEQKA